MRGRILDRDTVSWIRHLLDDTTWEPDRQAAADLLDTIGYLMENAGELPAQPITPRGLAPPQALSATGEPIHGKRGARPASRSTPHRPTLRLVPGQSGTAGRKEGAPAGAPTQLHLTIDASGAEDDDEPRPA